MATNYEDRQRGGYDSDDDGDRRPMGGRGPTPEPHRPRMKLILPPGVSAATFERAMKAFAGVVGDALRFSFELVAEARPCAGFDPAEHKDDLPV